MNASLDDLIRSIGLPAALRLVEQFGGTRVYFPHPSRVQIDGEMARTVGTDATRTLASVWPSELVTIPRAAAYLRRERDRAIHREKEQLSIRKLALKYELTERTVFRILLDEPPAEPQLERSRASQYPLF